MEAEQRTSHVLPVASSKPGTSSWAPQTVLVISSTVDNEISSELTVLVALVADRSGPIPAVNPADSYQSSNGYSVFVAARSVGRVRRSSGL